MLSHGNQTDIFRDRQATAREFRAAAKAALRNPFETPEACQRRHDHYKREAERAEQGRRG